MPAVTTRAQTEPAPRPQDSLSRVRSGQKVLDQGDRGLDVARAQKLLNQHGAQLAVDGRFGPKTDAAVRAFQRGKGLSVDGRVGQKTMAALEGRPAEPPSQATPSTPAAPSNPAGRPGNVSGPAATANTAGMTEAQKYDHYQKLIESKGGKLRQGPGEKNLVGLRTETNYKQSRGGKYDDKVAMIWKDARGNKRVREYQANMDPNGSNENRFGQDVNRDGRRDLGRVSEGYAEYQVGVHYGRARRYGAGDLRAKALRPTTTMRVDRDTNHNGRYDAGEVRNGTASDMLFHQGGARTTSSAGCQTMPPTEWARFWRDLRTDGAPGTIGYTAINVR